MTQTPHFLDIKRFLPKLASHTFLLFKKDDICGIPSENGTQIKVILSRTLIILWNLEQYSSGIHLSHCFIVYLFIYLFVVLENEPRGAIPLVTFPSLF